VVLPLSVCGYRRRDTLIASFADTIVNKISGVVHNAGLDG
jgi:hypothetical protein